MTKILVINATDGVVHRQSFTAESEASVNAAIAKVKADCPGATFSEETQEE